MNSNDFESLEIKLDGNDDISMLLGTHDKHIKFLEDNTETTINTRGEMIQIIGPKEEIKLVAEIIRTLQVLIDRGVKVATPDVMTALRLGRENHLDEFIMMYEEELLKDRSGKPIRPKNIGQSRYIAAIRKSDVVFGVGPAGTGKTYLAIVMAVAALKKGEVQRIILTRPAVEAGESLGFLPGDLKEKVDPYLRPLYDALYDMLGVEQTEKLMEKGVIEIAPLAYMRGRTLEDAYVILDEAQNTTDNQMKMFLTRLGFRSKMIVTGDISQIDLPRNTTSGLIRALDILEGVKGISFIHLSAMDVVRHPVVQRIIERYDGNNE